MMMRVGVIANIFWAGCCSGLATQTNGQFRALFVGLGVASGLLSIVLAIDDALMRARQ